MRPDSFTLSDGRKDVNSIGMECFNSLCALRSEKSTLHVHVALWFLLSRQAVVSYDVRRIESKPLANVHVMLFTDCNKNSRSVLFELLFCGFVVQNLQVRSIKRFISSLLSNIHP